MKISSFALTPTSDLSKIVILIFLENELKKKSLIVVRRRRQKGVDTPF